MWSSMQVTVIVAMAVLLTVVSAIAVVLGWRLRSLGRRPSAHAMQAWTQRLEALEALVRDSLSNRGPEPPAHPVGPRRIVRIDPAPESPKTPRLIAVPDLSTPPSDETDTAEALRQRYQEIWDQADSGLDAEAIARASGQPIGQIELILGLRRFGSTSRADRVAGV